MKKFLSLALYITGILSVQGAEFEEKCVDVFIVGSGPIGATYARQIVEGDPSKKVLMIDVGAQVSARLGTNAKNFYVYNGSEDGLSILSRKVQAELTPVSQPIQDPWPETLNPISSPKIPPVRYPINGGNPEQQDWNNMPAAASSFIVGGMGSHWTCCTPRPVGPEQIDFIDPGKLDHAFSRAEKLLHTNQESFTDSLRGTVVKEVLSDVFDGSLPDGRKVQMLPLACERTSKDWVEWTGTDTILGDLSNPGLMKERFDLWPEHLCRELILEDGKITSARIEHLITKKQMLIKANLFVIAANAFNTPQLLWNSGIRPDSLGRYMCDQPMIFCQVALKEKLLEKIASRWEHPPLDIDPVPIPYSDQIPNVWIPFSFPEHPFHCQIHRDAFPYGALQDNLGIDHRTIVELRWFTRKEVDRENRVYFSDKYKDLYEMPQPTIHYTLNKNDKETIHDALIDIAKAAHALGGYIYGAEPKCLPRGSSLHVTGTFRMGFDPIDSVCNPNSQVWGIDNLYLGGNGIIPTSTACNTTLTAMALAMLACDHILGR